MAEKTYAPVDFSRWRRKYEDGVYVGIVDENDTLVDFNGSGTAGTGDVSGPGGATDGQVAVFSGNDGKEIRAGTPDVDYPTVVSVTNAQTTASTAQTTATAAQATANSANGVATSAASTANSAASTATSAASTATSAAATATAASAAVATKVGGPASAVLGQVALFNATDGKTLTNSTATGIPKLTTGVASVATEGVDYIGGSASFPARTTKGRAATSGTVTNVAFEDITDPNFNLQTGTTYTLLASDRGKTLEFSNSNPITVTVPTAFSGFSCAIKRLQGAGLITLAASGTTINATSLVVSSAALLEARSGAANTFDLHGGLGDFQEDVADVVGAMFTAAGGTYDDTGGTITFPVPNPLPAPLRYDDTGGARIRAPSSGDNLIVGVIATCELINITNTTLAALTITLGSPTNDQRLNISFIGVAGAVTALTWTGAALKPTAASAILPPAIYGPTGIQLFWDSSASSWQIENVWRAYDNAVTAPWAVLATLSSYADGARYRAYDLGPAGIDYCYRTTGTKLSPIGRQCLYQGIDIAGVQSASEQLMVAVPLPAGVLVNQLFEITLATRNNGTTDAEDAVYVRINSTAAVGTTGTNELLAIAGLTAAQASGGRSSYVFNYVSSTSVRKMGTAGTGTASFLTGTTSNTATTTIIGLPSLTSLAYLCVVIDMAGATDTPTLSYLRVDLLAS